MGLSRWLYLLLALTTTVLAAPPKPTFRLSFEDHLEAEVARPGTTALVQGPLHYVDGRVGQALLVPAGSRLSFASAGHLSPAAGTVALWARLDLAASRPRLARLFDWSGPRSALRLLHPASNEVPFYAEVLSEGASRLPLPTGDARAIGDTWQHVALTWDRAGVTFYLNGVTLCSAGWSGPPPAPADRFYLGSEASGEQSAATALDEVCLYDRALDSLELCELAGRPPGTDPSAPNWLPNSSFEVGPQPWQTRTVDEHASTLAPTAGLCNSGQFALLIDRSLATDKAPSSAWLLGPWLHLARGRQVTLSAWLRSDQPAAEVSLQIQTGDMAGQVRGGPPGGIVRRDLRVDQRWRRYALTCSLPPAYKDGYRARLCVTSHPCRVWVDDLQFAAGPERTYQPKSPVEIGLISGNERADAEHGDWLQPVLAAYAPEGTKKVLAVNWGYRKPSPRNGFVDAEAAFFLLSPGQPAAVRLRPWRLDTCGVWTVEAADYGHSASRLSVAVTPYRRFTSPSRTSPFGSQSGGLASFERYGLVQHGDATGFLWRTLEQAAGQWSNQPVAGQAGELYRAGLELTGTLGAAPAWAATADGVPRSLDAWREYVRRTVAENNGQVGLWEVWDEPDLNPTLAADPKRYVELLRAARVVQRDVDSLARVAGPSGSGLNEGSFRFAQQVFDAGGLAAIDRVSWHALCPEAPEGRFLDGLRRINALVAEHQVSRPLVLTEYGTAGVADPALHIPWMADGWRRWDADEQAALLVRQSVLALWQGAVRLHWGQWDEERLQTGPDATGLLRADTYRSPKPALLALSFMATLLDQAALPPQRLSPRPGAWAFRFVTPGRNVACYWDPQGRSRPTWSTAATVYDLYGNVVPRGEWRLRPEPQWVVW